MLAEIYPLQVLLMTLSGLVNRHQADVIAYLVEENRVLKEQMKGRKLRLTDDQRRRLAAKAKLLVRQVLNQVATIVTPDTLLRWHRRLIAVTAANAVGEVCLDETPQVRAPARGWWSALFSDRKPCLERSALVRLRCPANHLCRFGEFD